MTDDVALFEQAVKFNHKNFADWAGTEEAPFGDRDIVGGRIHPDGGDQVLFDARGRAGFIGISHENWSDVDLVKVKNAKDKGYNLRLKKIPRQVSTIDLIKRYLWITNVFLDWLHAEGGSPYMVWATPEEIEAAFRAEAADFADDPHLALYWVMHFGLCDDPRYAEVAEMVRALGHDQSMDNMRISLAFFDATGVDHDFDLTPSYNPQGKDYSQLFLRRRANLLYMNYGQSFRGGGTVEPLWQSVSLYRRGDDYAIIRMRWLRNNLEKFDLWEALADRLNDAGSDDIPFISYPRIFQPDRADTAALADGLVSELLATRPTWSNRYGAFGKVLLHDIRAHIGNKDAYRAAAVIVFDGDMGNPQFAEILASVGEEGFGDAATREKLATFEGMFEGIRNLQTDGAKSKDAIFAKADALLSGLDRGGMAFFVGASSHFDARKVLLRHALLHPAEDQEDHIVNLFPRAAFADHELEFFFGEPQPPLVKAPDDAVARALLRVLDLPQTAFEAAHKRKRAVKSVCDLLRRVVHMPAAFDHVIASIEHGEADAVSGTLLEYMFTQKSKAEVQPLGHLSEDQVTRLIAAALKRTREIPEDFRSGLRLVVECTEHHPGTISDPSGDNFKALLAFTHTPDAAFRAPLDRSDALRTVFEAMSPAAEVPGVFDTLMNLIETDSPEGVASGVFDGVFSEPYYEPERNPVPRLNGAQVERLLDTALVAVERRPEDPKKPLRAIRACAVPEAKDWLTKTRADKALLKRLAEHRHNFVPLSDKLKDAIDDALDQIAERT